MASSKDTKSSQLFVKTWYLRELNNLDEVRKLNARPMGVVYVNLNWIAD